MALPSSGTGIVAVFFAAGAPCARLCMRTAPASATTMTAASRFMCATVLRPIPLGKVGETDLDERPDGLLESGFLGYLKGFLVRLAHLLGRDTLLEPVVAGDEELLDPFAGVVGGHVG